MAEEIEEATIVEEPKPVNNGEDTLARMSRIRTQIKQPGQNATSNFTPPDEEKKEAAKAAGPSDRKRENIVWKTNKSDFSDDDDYDDDEEGGAGEERAAQEPNPDEKKVKFTAASKAASARIFTRAFDSTQKITFTLMLNRRLKKKFTDQEATIIDECEEVERETIKDPVKLKALSKWDRIIKRHDEKLKAIPMTPEEREDLKQMLMDYQDHTQQLLSPAWGIALSVSNVLVQRSIDVFTD